MPPLLNVVALLFTGGHQNYRQNPAQPIQLTKGEWEHNVINHAQFSIEMCVCVCARVCVCGGWCKTSRLWQWHTSHMLWGGMINGCATVKPYVWFMSGVGVGDRVTAHAPSHCVGSFVMPGAPFRENWSHWYIMWTWHLGIVPGLCWSPSAQHWAVHSLCDMSPCHVQWCLGHVTQIVAGVFDLLGSDRAMKGDSCYCTD